MLSTRLKGGNGRCNPCDCRIQCSGIQVVIIKSIGPPTVLYCTVLCCTVLYHAAVPQSIVLCTTVMHCFVLYCAMRLCTALHCSILFCTVLYCTVLYCTVVTYTVQCVGGHIIPLQCVNSFESMTRRIDSVKSVQCGQQSTPSQLFL